MENSEVEFKSSVSSILTKTGLLVLDAHRVPLDIIQTANSLRKQFPDAEIIMPLAGYLFHVPIIAQMTTYWAKIKRITLMPVYRKEEMNPTSFWMGFFCKFYPIDLTDEIKRSRNHAYQDAIGVLIHNKSTILLVAPYGGSYKLGEGVLKSGVTNLLEQCDYFCFSLSKLWAIPGTSYSKIYAHGQGKTQVDDAFLHQEFESLYQLGMI